MGTKKKIQFIMIVSLTLLLTPCAWGARENPASCLFFPYYDTSGDTMSIHTITNVGNTAEYVRLVFVDGYECTPVDYWFMLTAGDTFTFGAHGILPWHQTGFLYAYVVEDQYSSNEKDADVLIGQEIVLGSWNNTLVNFSLNAIGFQALDLTPDGKLHLDGVEFTAAPKTIYFPRFFGQEQYLYSKMILINLTGGRYFKASTNVYVYNDNEQVFSDHLQIDCFGYASLQEILPHTSKYFLLGSNHNPNEPWPFYTIAETGTIRMTGIQATNIQGTMTIPNASILCVLVEGFATMGYTAADLPLQIEAPNTYNNAMLWSVNPSGT